MAGEYRNLQARRVITGFDPRGRSCVVSDEDTSHKLATPGNTKCDIWRFGSIPAPVDDIDGIDAVVTQPPEHGLVHRVVSFPPDREWDRSQGYGDAHGPLATASSDSQIQGLHVTDTIDIVTVLSGELVCELETEAVVLRPGDSLVQRGTPHSWSNRCDEPAVAVVIMVSADRASYRTSNAVNV